MKKLFLAVAVLLILGISAIYLLIPKELVISHSVVINTSDKNVFQFLRDNKKWARWLPETHPSVNKTIDSSFHYGNQTFTTDDLVYNSLAVTIRQHNVIETSRILIVALKPDTAAVIWESRLNTGFNPITRIKTYLTATNTKKNMVDILGSLKSFLDKTENIYGYPIVFENIKDTLYIAYTIVQNSYLDTKLLTMTIDKLHAYTKLTDGIEAGVPIMIVSHLETGEYRTVIGMPINKPIPETKDFVLKTMPKGGRIISTQVVGGMQNMLKGLDAISKYQSDFLLDQPIIPYFSLITDRAKEPDSAKWITKVVGPIY